jgi:hypothetical protein
MWPGTAAPSILRSTPAVFCAAVFLPAVTPTNMPGCRPSFSVSSFWWGETKLGDAAREGAVRLDLKPVGLLARLHLDVGAELVDLLARQLAAGDGDRLDGAARGEGLKFAAREAVCNVGDEQVDAQIGLVRAIELERVVVGDALETARERRRK